MGSVSRSTIGLFVVGGLLVALGLAFFVSPLASASPDGLEKVSIDEGFDAAAEDHALGDSTFADYGVDGVEDEGLSTRLAGVVGVVLTFGVGLLIFAGIRTIRARYELKHASGASAPNG